MSATWLHRLPGESMRPETEASQPHATSAVALLASRAISKTSEQVVRPRRRFGDNLHDGDLEIVAHDTGASIARYHLAGNLAGVAHTCWSGVASISSDLAELEDNHEQQRYPRRF